MAVWVIYKNQCSVSVLVKIFSTSWYYFEISNFQTVYVVRKREINITFFKRKKQRFKFLYRSQCSNAMPNIMECIVNKNNTRKKNDFSGGQSGSGCCKIWLTFPTNLFLLLFRYSKFSQLFRIFLWQSNLNLIWLEVCTLSRYDSYILSQHRHVF